MPPARKPPPSAASKRAPAPPAAEAGVSGRETGVGGKEMDVEDRHEVEPKVEAGEDPEAEEDPDEVEPEEDPDEEADEDPEEAEEGAEQGEGNEEEAVPEVGPGDATELVIKEGSDAAMVLKEGGYEDTRMEPAAMEEPEEAVKDDEEPKEAEEEKTEGMEEDVKNDDEMEADTTKVLGEGATVDDMNEIPEEEEPGDSGDRGTHGDNDKDGDAGQLSADGDASGCQNGDVQNDELDPSLIALGPISVGNAKDLEIFVGGLPKDCSEEDITMAFSQFGEIVLIRIIKKSAKKKNKCIAFVCYKNTEGAEKALAEFKEGTEVKGKRVRVSASQGNNTLYLGNICKSWTKDQVLNTLKSIGIEEFEMSLPDDADTGGRNRGITFLKFATHDNAEAAFQQLKRPGAFFGIDRSAEESFARTPKESSEELLMKVKTVYLKHVPLSWDERKIEECCEGYGKIQKVSLFRKSKKSDKKMICFVEFSLRKSALACVEGINNTKIGGEVKLFACLAWPPRKIQLAKNNAKGGPKVNNAATCEDAEKSKRKEDQKKDVAVKKNSPHKLPKGDESKLTSQGDVEVPQTSNPNKGKRKAGKSKNTSVQERSSKKARKNRDVLTRPSNERRRGGYARATYAGQSAGNKVHPAGSRYAANYQAGPSVGTTSRSKPSSRDLEPHAGYIPLTNRVPANRVQRTYVYDQQRTAPYNVHQINDLPYTREIAVPQPAYSLYTSNPQNQGEYAYTYLPPPQSGSYHPGSGSYNPRRGYY